MIITSWIKEKKCLSLVSDVIRFRAQERGEIFFFYRPKVEREEAHSPEDVQRMYIVLCPESGERPVEEKQASDSGKEGEKLSDKDDDRHRRGGGSEGGHGKEEVNIEKERLLRLLVMGRKSLPEPAKRGRPYWGYVELVTTNIDHVKAALREEEYDTATRGHRHKPAARALGEGIYCILRHGSGLSGKRVHTHLIYKLELPPSGGEVEPQEALHVDREASFLIQIKNPEQPGGARFSGLQQKRKAALPAHLQGRLGTNRFAPADPPDFLNYEGCEFLLISASDDVEEELGLELETECECADAGCSDLLQMLGEVADAKPLMSGAWD